MPWSVHLMSVVTKRVCVSDGQTDRLKSGSVLARGPYIPRERVQGLYIEAGWERLQGWGGDRVTFWIHIV